MTDSDRRDDSAWCFDAEAAAPGGVQGALQLPPDHVHVWSVSLGGPREVYERCSQWLSRAEQTRADRFKFEQDRHHFVVAHGALRYILSRYCGQQPGTIELDQTDKGKPYLRNRSGLGHAVTFNLTHSHGRGLIAVSGGLEVGVDLELVRQDTDHLSLAKRFFSPSEWRVIEASEPGEQSAVFFRHWVGKEAMLKAKGAGLQLPLDRCELIMDEAGSAAVVYWHERGEAHRAWMVRFLPLERGWAGAVAAQGRNWTFKYRSLGKAVI